MVFQKSKYKQICTFFVPGNFESGENSINDQNQGMFLHGENFAPKRTKILRIFYLGMKDDMEAKFSFYEVELHLWYLMYSLFAIKKNYWNTVGSF